MPNVPPMTFSEISARGYFSLQPEGFLMQKVSVIHFLPVSVNCKYRAMPLSQNQKVFPRKRFV